MRMIQTDSVVNMLKGKNATNLANHLKKHPEARKEFESSSKIISRHHHQHIMQSTASQHVYCYFSTWTTIEEIQIALPGHSYSISLDNKHSNEQHRAGDLSVCQSKQRIQRRTGTAVQAR